MALKRDFTKGSLNKQIFLFAVPVVISNLFQALYNAVDMYFVGKYLGTVGTVAVSVGGPIMNLLFMAVAGMGLGVTILLGSLIGTGDEEKIKRTANTAIVMFLAAAVIITFLGLFLTPHILRWIATPQEAMADAKKYLSIIFCGMVFTLGYNLVCAMQRGFGDSKSSMYFVIAACMSNIILDYILIAHLKMEVTGAAIATVISQAVSFISSIVYFRSKKHIVTFSPKDWTFDKTVAKDLVRIGLPSALQQATINVAYLALNGIVNTYGLAASAAYGICVKLDSFAILPSTAVNDSVAAVTSQNLGVGQTERAVKGISAGRKLIIPFNFALMLAMFFFGHFFASIFNTDPVVVDMAAKYLKVSCFMYVLYGIYYPLMGFIKGTGNAMFALKNTIFAQLILRIPVAYFFAKVLNFGFYGVAAAWIAAPISSNTIYTIYLKSGRWLKRLEANKAKGKSI